jgi:hypothetical protein
MTVAWQRRRRHWLDCLSACAMATARVCGCTGMIIVRMDSAYYNASVKGAIRAQGARFRANTSAPVATTAAVPLIGPPAATGEGGA